MSRLELDDLKGRARNDLIESARSLGVLSAQSLTDQQLIFELLRVKTQDGVAICGGGVLEVLPDGFGFLRAPQANYLPGSDDIYVSPSQIRRFNLRTGDHLRGVIRAPRGGEKYFALIKVESINDRDPEAGRGGRLFESLTPIYPNSPFQLEHDPDDHATRLLDLLAPIGRGARVLLVAPPRSGHRRLMRSIGRALQTNHPDAHVIAMLIDARPEDVTETRRALQRPGGGFELLNSTFDEPPARHVQIAEMVLDRGRRLVEQGLDVVILLDSLTGLTRAYNQVAAEDSERPVDELDPAALLQLKRFFGAARNAEEGGSLTVVGALMVGTGAVLDQQIHDGLVGAANLEVVLNGGGRAIDPALDLAGCRACALDHLLKPDDLAGVLRLQAALGLDGHAPVNGAALAQATEWLIQWSTNRELLDNLPGTGN